MAYFGYCSWDLSFDCFYSHPNNSASYLISFSSFWWSQAEWNLLFVTKNTNWYRSHPHLVPFSSFSISEPTEFTRQDGTFLCPHFRCLSSGHISCYPHDGTTVQFDHSPPVFFFFSEYNCSLLVMSTCVVTIRYNRGIRLGNNCFKTRGRHF